MAETTNELDISVGSFPIKVRGREAVTALLFCVLIFGIAFFFWREIDQQNKDVQAQHKTMQEGIDALIYVNSLTADERAKLNLTMPPKVREMMRRD